MPLVWLCNPLPFLASSSYVFAFSFASASSDDFVSLSSEVDIGGEERGGA